MSLAWSNKLPETPGHPSLEERKAINEIVDGHTNNHGEVDLTTATAVTTVANLSSCTTATVVLVPMNAAARAEFLAGTAYVSATRGGEFDITHPSGSAQRTFRYAWIG